MEFVLLIGAQPYRISEEDARWLKERICSTCVDELGRPVDSDAVATLALADVIAEELDGGVHAEPIELGIRQAIALTEHTLTPGAAAEHDMAELYDALIRFRG